MTLKISLLILAACSQPTTSRSALAVTAQTSGCLGAVANDGHDDTADIQRAIAKKCCLAAGVYDVDMAPRPAVGRRSYNMLTVGTGQELCGAGAGTVLRFRGDAGGQDWRGVELAGTGASVHDLAIDTALLTGTVEQTHALHVTGPVTNPRISRLTINHPPRSLPGGDCVQLVGYAATPIRGARIDHLIAHCDRSGVAAHSGVIDLEITDSVIDAGDQEIDGEGTGEGSDQWLIARNTFSTTAASQGVLSIQIQATGHVHITGNTLLGRGVHLYGCQHCELDHDTITRVVAGALGVVEIEKDSADIVIHDETLERMAAAGAGAVIRAAPHGTGVPSGIRVVDSSLTQRSAGNVVDAVGIIGLEVSRNVIAYSGPASGGYAVNAVATPTVQTSGIVVDSNVITGPLAACVRVSNSYSGTGSVSLVGNGATGPVQGVRCEISGAAGRPIGPVTSTDNAWPTSACSAMVNVPRVAPAERL